MKRKFLFVLTSLFFLALTPFVSATENNYFEIAVEQELSFSEIEASEVPNEVLKAAKKEFPGTEVTKTLVAEVSGKKVYKIVVTDSEGNENSGLYNSDGENYSPKV